MPNTVGPHHIHRQSSPVSSKKPLILGAVILILLSGNTIALFANAGMTTGKPQPNFSSIHLPTMTNRHEAKSIHHEDVPTEEDEKTIIAQQRSLLFTEKYLADENWFARSQGIRNCISVQFSRRVDLTYEQVRDTCIAYYQNNGHE